MNEGLIFELESNCIIQASSGAKVNVPGMGTIAANTEGSLSVETAMGNLNTNLANLEEGISISAGIGAVTLRAKNDSGLRQRLNQDFSID